MRKWCQRLDREYLIESFFEALDLDLDRIMEGVVQNQIDVVLDIFDRHLLLKAFLYELNVLVIHRQVEVRAVNLDLVV